MKKLFIYSVVVLALVFPVSAQNTTQNTATPQITPVFQGIDQGTRERVREEIKARRDELKSNIKGTRDEFKANIQERRAELKDLIQGKRETLKEQLQKVKDERKKAAVERIDARLDELNERIANHFSNVLDKLENVLERIASRADKAEEKGLDVAAVRTAIDSALKAIEASRTAVQTQAGKTYTITVSSENNLRVDVGEARQALHSDLVKVREMVKAAHDAVRQAAVILAQIPRVNEAETLPVNDGQNNSNQ